MRIGGKALAARFLAEIQELLLGQAPFDEGARINARTRMPLDVDEVAAMRLRRRVPEMAKADVVERGRRLEARDVSAKLGRFLVGAQNDGNRVPADDGADAVLNIAIPVGAL